MLSLLGNLKRYHYVLGNFVVRDLKVKYRGTLLGYLWSLLEPMSLVLVYWFVFVVIARRGGVDYPLLVILGVLPYNLFSNTIQAGATSLTANASLIRRVYIPREIFVLAGSASQLVVYGLSLFAVIPFMIIYGAAPGPSLLLLPIAVLGLLSLASGIALVAACANVLYRDVGYLLRVVLRLLFYGTPVIFTAEMIPEHIRGLFFLNPISVWISLARSAVLNRPLLFELHHALSAVAASILCLGLGMTVFRRLENRAVKSL